MTGIRQDDYAKEHPIVVETMKGAAERGARQFVPKGSTARLMKSGPAQPKATPQAAPTKVPAQVTVRPAD